MALDLINGQTVRVTITKPLSRHTARKTIERLFMKDRAIAKPIENRARNFIPLPRRRGGRIWTKYPNKVHPELVRGTAATLKVTPQFIKDLNSVADFVSVDKA